jgi:thioredoxin-dependent peroxiredoxin
MQLDVGQQSPDFTADSSQGTPLTLSDLRGRWVVLYFYPKDDTPGCTKQACAFRDTHAKLSGKNVVVVGCSPDDLRSHDKFISKYDLPFVLISDQSREIASTYGVWKEKNMYGKRIKGIERTTFLINPDGEIAKIWSRVRVDGHIDEIIDELQMIAR